MLEEKEAIYKEHDERLEERRQDHESEIAELEEDEANEVEIKAVSRQLTKDLEAITEEYELEVDLCERAFEEFRGLFPRQIIEDELLWRELVDRYGEYFEGGMGADAIAQLVERLDFDEEELKLRDAIDPPPDKSRSLLREETKSYQAAQNCIFIQSPKRKGTV